MPATASGPQINTATLTENSGRYESLVVDYSVTGLTPGIDALDEAMTTTGIPTYNDSYSADANLRVTDKSVRMNQNSTTSAVVTVTYSHISDMDQANIIGTTIVKTNVGLTQEPTELDFFGNQITVSHTYTNDPDFGTVTQTQGGRVDVFRPHVTRQVSGQLQFGLPHLIARKYIGKLNQRIWGYDAVGTWLCTDASYEPWNTPTGETTKYLFNFEFEFKRDGWQPFAAFNDQRTGTPPNGIVADVGIKQITAYGYADFNELTPNVV